MSSLGAHCRLIELQQNKKKVMTSATSSFVPAVVNLDMAYCHKGRTGGAETGESP